MVRPQPRHHSVQIGLQIFDHNINHCQSWTSPGRPACAACAQVWKHRTVVAYSGGLCHTSYNELHHSGIPRITRCPTMSDVPEAEEQYMQEVNISYSRQPAAKWKAMLEILQWAWRGWLRCRLAALCLGLAFTAAVCAIIVTCGIPVV